MAWVESRSETFHARHEDTDGDAAAALLDRLEGFREEMRSRFGAVPEEVTVVIHPRAGQLTFAHPWLPIARFVAAPAARRYMAGWFSKAEIHVLGPTALEDRASRVPGSREALGLSPLHEYAHLAVGVANPDLPPPFTPGSFARYIRWAWLCEGAAVHFSGQSKHLRPAIATRLREGPRPSFPPSARDAFLLGGTIFDLIEEGDGPEACVALASRLPSEGQTAAIERAFMRTLPEVERDWRDYLMDVREP